VDKLGYTAMTAAARTMMSLQVQANNLANVNTAGFRADMDSAEAVAVEGYGYDSRHLVTTRGVGVDMRPGAAMQTGRPLDVAIAGNGLIAVETATGEAYTRNGAMQLDADMTLTIGGRAVIGDGGPIVLPAHDRIEIAPDGTISVLARGEQEMAEVGRIKLVNPPAIEVSKRLDGLLGRTDGRPFVVDDAVRLQSGYLESSNVSAIEQLTTTMSLSRQFEAQVKMMKAAEDLSSAGNRMLRGS